MRKEIRDRLMLYADSDYAKFSEALIPGAKPLLGVRLPKLREMAKDIVKGDWHRETESVEDNFEDIYFEETMLRGIIIAYGISKRNVDVNDGISYFEKFVPLIDNWSVCDSFCNSCSFANKHRDEMWEALQKYLYSDEEFEVRTALIMLLNQYLKYDNDNKKRSRRKKVCMADITDNTLNRELSKHVRKDYPYLERILDALNREFYQGYYARMAAAWLLAEAFVYFPYEVNQMLVKNCRLDKWTRNKAIQKITESLNPDAEVKEYMKILKKS